MVLETSRTSFANPLLPHFPLNILPSLPTPASEAFPSLPRYQGPLVPSLTTPPTRSQLHLSCLRLRYLLPPRAPFFWPDLPAAYRHPTDRGAGAKAPPLAPQKSRKQANKFPADPGQRPPPRPKREEGPKSGGSAGNPAPPGDTGTPLHTLRPLERMSPLPSGKTLTAHYFQPPRWPPRAALSPLAQTRNRTRITCLPAERPTVSN